MSASNSIHPNNIAVLAAVGIAAYWFLTRRAVAAPVVTPAGVAGATPAAPNIANVLGGLVGSITNLFNPGASAGAQAQAAAVGAANALSDTYAGADWSALASSAVDGVAYNPPTSSAYDSLGMSYLDGSGSLGD
jgi:hypothetical protein